MADKGWNLLKLTQIRWAFKVFLFPSLLNFFLITNMVQLEKNQLFSLETQIRTHTLEPPPALQKVTQVWCLGPGPMVANQYGQKTVLA